ncbi:PaaX family transcriptional regulator C-terminal domain-containing protein [Roseibium salinum]|nr:PaaX family transcriptional regulator C-terminal domain-containing protein [Roseibium salinum]
MLGTAFRATALRPEAQDLKALVSSAFDLQALSADYAVFINGFRTMKSVVAENAAGETALLLRLALVHAYRAIRLRDPRLPPVRSPG